MKKTAFFALVLFALHLSPLALQAQRVYWVFLADKAGSSFDPYTYFDAKALERYTVCGADLYDQSNYPLTESYVTGVNAIATAVVGQSRWLNAVGVVATATEVAAIERLPYVLRVQPIEGDMTIAEYPSTPEPSISDYAEVDGPLEAQLVRMQGQLFREKGIDGKGIRIAVFDGGFPRVNTHDAFKHLRDNHQILKTWNFPNNKEDVYGWNSHGTMTLSCIAGRIGGKDLGLATGAEFLLARTEVNAEPFKEEVWWQMAVEWADKNGANIISSSLGYGKERHYTTDMDGTSYVAKAANMAARKGMLVVNSAGNEADSRQWKTIITPADADSVLCIGGIENSLTEYNHIAFSSYGPSADGRQKPNVCAFGYAHTAAVGNDHASHYVHGTSFSCPLVAGFAACAWQASPGKTCMEMFREIERSADLYPYCDYTFGYGVPQAGFFTQAGNERTPTFRFETRDGEVLVRPLRPIVGKPVFFKEQRADGHIERYAKETIVYLDTTGALHFTLQPNRTLVVHIDGYTDSYTDRSMLNSTAKTLDEHLFGLVTSEDGHVATGYDYRTPEMNLTPSEWGSNAKYRYNVYFGLGLPVATDNAEMATNFWSPSWNFGVRLLHSYSKTYCIGIGIGMTFTRYRFNDAQVNDFEETLGITQADIDNYKEVINRRLEMNEILNLELFQRIRLRSVGLLGHGLHWDLGLYASGESDTYTLGGNKPAGISASYAEQSYVDATATTDYRITFGAVTRLTYDMIGIYARYRLEDIGKKPDIGKVLLPRLTVGLQLQF